MNKWTTYKRRLLELQDTLNRNPIQDAFIALAIEILLALLEDRIKKSGNQYNELSNIIIKDSMRNLEVLTLKEILSKDDNELQRNEDG